MCIYKNIYGYTVINLCLSISPLGFLNDNELHTPLSQMLNT